MLHKVVNPRGLIYFPNGRILEIKSISVSMTFVIHQSHGCGSSFCDRGPTFQVTLTGGFHPRDQTLYLLLPWLDENGFYIRTWPYYLRSSGFRNKILSPLLKGDGNHSKHQWKLVYVIEDPPDPRLEALL